MNLSGVSVSSQRDVLDVFESLFQTYSNIPVQELPKFRKRRLSCKGSLIEKDGRTTPISIPEPHSNQPDRIAPVTEKNASNTSALTPPFSSRHNKGRGSVPLQLITSPDDGCESALPGPVNSSHGSFSSGVFSIESDIDSTHDDEGDDDETSSETGSGIMSCSDQGEDGSLPENEQHNPEGVDGSYGKEPKPVRNFALTDQDILFMIHKPRLKKRRKKPPWQNRKLDLDDLWVKGHHRWSSPNNGEVEKEAPNKPFLNRNLEWGKISLRNYICTVRKSRKLRKPPCGRPSSSPSKKQKTNNRSISSSEIQRSVKYKDWQTQKQSPKKELKKKLQQKLNTGNKETVSKAVGLQKSVANNRTCQDSSSETSSLPQGCTQRSSVNRSTRKSSWTCDEARKVNKRSNSNRVAAQQSKSSERVSEARVKASQSTVRRKGNEKSESSNDSRTISLIDRRNRVLDQKRRKGDKMPRPRTDVGASGDKTKRSTDERKCRTCTDRNLDRREVEESKVEESESEGSIINFVSLTPKRSKKPSRRKKKQARKSVNLDSNSESTDFESSLSRRRILASQVGVLTSEYSEWDDGSIEYQPLFGRTRHCGGVWNSIVEESS